jgi:hypothetical protein
MLNWRRQQCESDHGDYLRPLGRLEVAIESNNERYEGRESNDRNSSEQRHRGAGNCSASFCSGQHQRRGIAAWTLAPTRGKELEPLPCAARTELNTIAERTNTFAGPCFNLVKSAVFPPDLRPRSHLHGFSMPPKNGSGKGICGDVFRVSQQFFNQPCSPCR